MEFLDSVLESTRAKEAEVRKETTEQLDAFKRQQEEAEKAATQEDGPSAVEVNEAWTAGPRKRKKGRESTIGGVKLRRTSTTEKAATEKASIEETVVPDTVPKAPAKAAPVDAVEDIMPATKTRTSESTTKPADGNKPASKPPSPGGLGLGLAAYSSDEDE